MSRRKVFIENIFTYGMISIVNKIVPFILLPIITRILSNASEFGVYSLFTTIIGFGTPLAILGLYDAMFREYFENDDEQYKQNVIKTTLIIITFSSFFLSLNLIIFRDYFSKLFFNSDKYSFIILLAGITIFLDSLISPVQAPTRLLNNKRVFVISGLLQSFVTYVLSLLLVFHGYSFLGLIYAVIFSSFIMFVFFWNRNSVYFRGGTFDFKIAKELLRVGIPLMPTFLIYWIYSSMDKIMISNMLGTSDLGIYSIGSKMAQVSQLIYAGFAGGWQFFAFSTMKDKDQVELNSKIFDYLGAISVISIIIIYPFMPFFFRLFFTGEYAYGYLVAPYLYLSPLMLMLFQIIANQFIVIKRSYLSTISLSVGAVLNIVLNFYLIKLFGIEGASIATLIGYLISIILVMFVSKRMGIMKYSARVILILSFIPLFFYTQRIYLNDSVFLQFLFSGLFCIIVLSLYYKEIALVLKIGTKLKYR